MAIVPAADDTTNAIGLPFAEVFQPLYGPRSAAQFRAHAAALDLVLHELDLPNLRDDVDTPADLERIGPGGGRRTRSVVALLEA
jgi:2-phospho-L-lactate guanylyltransferase (CobY/MobA/RfbA family)